MVGALSEAEELTTLRAEERGPHVHVTTHWKYTYHQAYLLAEQEELAPPIPDLTLGAASAAHDPFAAAAKAAMLSGRRRLAVDDAESASMAKHLLPGLCHSAYAAAAAVPRRVFDRQRWNWEAFCAGKSRGPHTLHEEMFNFQSPAAGTELNCTAYDCAGLQARHYQRLGCARGLLELPVLAAFEANPHAYRSAIFERPPSPGDHPAAAAAPCHAGADGSRERAQGHGKVLASLWSWGARMWQTAGSTCAKVAGVQASRP